MFCHPALIPYNCIITAKLESLPMNVAIVSVIKRLASAYMTCETNICTNYNQLSCLISHIRCAKRV